MTLVSYTLSLDDVIAAVEEDDMIGLCIHCGAESRPVDQDARGDECLECGEFKVYGAMELLFELSP